MRKIVSILMICFLLFSLTSCKMKAEKEYIKYTNSFFDTFDTMIMVVGYTESEAEFNTYFEEIHQNFQRYHKLFDRYNDYKGINNIKTINDNAGVSPVKVDQEIIDLLLFSKEWHDRTGGIVNIAFGPVLKIWHDYRTEGFDNPETAQLPPMEKLKKAAAYIDLDEVIIDEENNTVFLTNKNMILDVGAVAKGYATEMTVRKVVDKGMQFGIISAGGNIRTIGNPPVGKGTSWVIGVQNPEASLFSANKDLDALFVNETSIVSSGNYQRYYYVDDEVFHHIIDPKTLMPANYYQSVTVMVKDSGVADFLSTTLFLLPYGESLSLAEGLDGVEALWVMPNGKIEATKGMKKTLKSQGATNK